jgi:signal transduction histidine kinase
VLGIGIGVVLRLVSGSAAPALLAFFSAVVLVALNARAVPGFLCWGVTLIAGLWACGGSVLHPVLSNALGWVLGTFAVSTALMVFICARARQAALADRAALMILRQRVEFDASRAARSKDALLSKISHELRTPLSAILGWTQVLRAQTPPAPLAHGLEVIERNARAQTRIIEDLIDANQTGTERKESESSTP